MASNPGIDACANGIDLALFLEAGSNYPSYIFLVLDPE